ncbi:sestrin-3 [Neodiprion lecontei]|uniref:Sestrin-3 n=1 Tax=Neodiprion lecontei TaxID=441921 RepID=A0ABM3GMH7_NEOLC|nr:sestrin-3 [Neodiprion lecontei]
MYKDQSSSSSLEAASKNGEVELVSRFLAPLCARDEAARNIALAAARTTVEGWLGGVGSPDVVEGDARTAIFRYEDNTSLYETLQLQSNSVNGSNSKSDEVSTASIPMRQLIDPSLRYNIIRDDFRTEEFFPQSVTDNGIYLQKDTNYDPGDGLTSFDILQGNNTGDHHHHHQQVHQGDSEPSPHHHHGVKPIKIKGAKQKVDQDDVDVGAGKVYGKSPRFDNESLTGFGRTPPASSGYPSGHFDLLSGNFVSKNDNFVAGIEFEGGNENSNVRQASSYRKNAQFYGTADEVFFDDDPVKTGAPEAGGVVFNTLDGFEGRRGSEDRRESSGSLRKSIERKVSAGQIKRPLSQDDDVSSKNGPGALPQQPEVTPGDVGRMLNLGNALDGPKLLAQPNKYLSLVTLHLPVILRLSVNCPFQNVRTKCAEILEMVKERGLPVPEPAFDGPSAFVPTSELPDLGNHDDRAHMLLMDAFLQNNRLDHVSRVMAGHPTYLEHFLRTQHFILRGDGPLPYDYRHLIAIMAAGRHQCSYLINLQKGEFLLQGGASSWLQGLKSIPSKLQDLYEINKILAHRPWLLNKTHIEKLTKGADNWSLAEVVHAIVLLAHFHSLSSFVFSCGINEELDSSSGHHYKECSGKDNGKNVQPVKDIKVPSSSPTKIPGSTDKTDNMPSPPPSPSILGEQEVGVETLMERMKRLSEKSESYQITQEELSKRFETVESQSAELTAAPQRSSVLDSDIGLFIDDPTFIYQDFAKRGQLNDIPTFRVQDYSWDDHGYSLVNRLYNDVGNLLDDKFKTAYNLTYYTMGTHSKVDTSRFRRAIWNYIQCMFGIRHDDYDYNEVNQLLERSLKTFIKSAVCYPERVTKRDYDRVMREFKHSEKIHVNLMILEARMQAELLYALRAVMRYMT